VTQQDAATSTTIARETREDGNSVKIIAALTMVFLPGTYLSSVFGMAALENARWWLYMAITLPRTILVLAVWWVWIN
jgi:Mg2+ and Co2+ transporter CorA